MNCKPGDLAVIVRSAMGNEGGMVRVLDAVDCAIGEWRCEAMSRLKNQWGWIAIPGEIGWAEDANLRPIRPGDISDEEVRDLYAPKLPEVA